MEYVREIARRLVYYEKESNTKMEIIGKWKDARESEKYGR